MVLTNEIRVIALVLYDIEYQLTETITHDLAARRFRGYLPTGSYCDPPVGKKKKLKWLVRVHQLRHRRAREKTGARFKIGSMFVLDHKKKT